MGLPRAISKKCLLNLFCILLKLKYTIKNTLKDYKKIANSGRHLRERTQ